MIEILETLLAEIFETVARINNSVTRQLSFPTSPEMIKVAIGMRRAGKSYFLYQTINQLLSEGIPKEQILMINFEDDRLLPMTSKEMGVLLDAFYTLYPDNYDNRCYFFLDEVQTIPGWEHVVRRFFDSKNIQLYLSGSSAKLLSKEIATSLRGRALSVEVWPYSFSEYQVAHGITALDKPFSRKNFDILRGHLFNYFSIGGFPAVQFMPKNEWRDTLQSYVDTVILRDIVERHDVTNISLLKYLITTLLKNAATLFSVNKFYNDIKSQGYQVSKNTIYTYMDYIQDAFLVFSVPLYTESERLKQNSPKKIYVVDNGLINASSLGINNIYNKLFENQIYLNLRREGRDIYFYKTTDGFEVDFVTIDKDGSRELIQVTFDMNDPKTADREKRALEQAKKELGIPGKIMTLQDYLRSL